MQFIGMRLVSSRVLLSSLQYANRSHVGMEWKGIRVLGTYLFLLHFLVFTNITAS
jgi:hypothetical protein